MDYDTILVISIIIIIIVLLPVIIIIIIIISSQTELGEFGWWQRANTLLLWLPAIATGANIMVETFVLLEQLFTL